MFIFFVTLLLAAVYTAYLLTCHPGYRHMGKSRRPSISLARKFLVDSVKPVNLTAVIYMCICRILWLLDPHPNSVTVAGHIYRMQAGTRARPAASILISTPQTLALLALTLMISLWRRVTNNAQHIRRRAKSIKAETAAILVAAVFLLFVALPLAIASSFVDSLILVSNAIFGLYMIFMCSLASYYITVLQGIVKKLRSDKTKLVVLRIERTVQCCILACLTLVFGIFYDAIFIDRCQLKTSSETNSQYLVYIWFVHVGELIGCSAIIFALLPARAKAAQYAGGDSGQDQGSTAVTETDGDLEADRFAEGSRSSFSMGRNSSLSVAHNDESMEQTATELTQKYTVEKKDVS